MRTHIGVYKHNVQQYGWASCLRAMDKDGIGGVSGIRNMESAPHGLWQYLHAVPVQHSVGLQSESLAARLYDNLHSPQAAVGNGYNVSSGIQLKDLDADMSER